LPLAGKSSTSLACLAAGLELISDDYLALALDPERTRVSSVFVR
jgi:serine kinase of HPr protein (carbohydrate metabolism regulator)